MINNFPPLMEMQNSLLCLKILTLNTIPVKTVTS